MFIHSFNRLIETRIPRSIYKHQAPPQLTRHRSLQHGGPSPQTAPDGLHVALVVVGSVKSRGISAKMSIVNNTSNETILSSMNMSI